MKKRDYRNYLEDMLTSVIDIESFTEGMTFDSFKVVFDIIKRRISNLYLNNGYRRC